MTEIYGVDICVHDLELHELIELLEKLQNLAFFDPSQGDSLFITTEEVTK